MAALPRCPDSRVQTLNPSYQCPDTSADLFLRLLAVAVASEARSSLWPEEGFLDVCRGQSGGPAWRRHRWTR
jgi:hypothetical protein